MKQTPKKSARFYIILNLSILLIFALIFTVFRTLSRDTSDSGWDGVVAREFTSGTGTEANPFVISNASEFAYFKHLLESDDALAYIDKNYVITSGFNYGEYEISINNNIPFAGNIDGMGNLISNAKIINNLFNLVDGATIKNINFDEIDYSLTGETGALLANEMSNSDIEMVLFNSDVTISTDGNHSFGGLVYTSKDNKYNDIIINSNILNDVSDSYKFVYESIDDEGNNILINKDKYNNSKDDTNISIANYEIANDSINLIDINDIDSYANDTYKIVILNDRFVIEKIETEPVNQDTDDDEKDDNDNIPDKEPVKRLAVVSDTITEHASGSDGNTFYINDLTADKNYLKGLNYTEVRNTSLPSGVSTGYYDDNYLVKVEIIYDGADINNSSLVGALSPINNENTNTFVYFKYYPLERNSNGTLATDSDGNNYIEIELIDNPFSKRPYVNSVEYGFNGWVCNQSADTTTGVCDAAKFSLNTDDYTRHLQLPINGGSEVIIHLNATWYEADVVTSAGNITYFNSMTMVSTGYTVQETIVHHASYFWRQNYTQMVFVRQYVRGDDKDGYMPAGSFYRTNRNTGTYYYNTNRTRCRRNETCYVFEPNTSAIVAGTKYNGGSVTFITNFRPTNSNTETTINTYNTTYMELLDDPDGQYTYNETVQRQKSYIPTGNDTQGFFYKVSNPTSAMIQTGMYYNSSGTLCTSTSGCSTAYKLIHYNDEMLKSNGNSISIIEEDANNEVIGGENYYYLVTRDMNIVRITNTVSYSNLTTNRPFTLTGTAINGTTASGTITMNTSRWTIPNDIVIENIQMDGPNYNLNTTNNKNRALGYDSTNYTSYGGIFVSSHNFKIGRNVTPSEGASYLSTGGIYGGAYGSSPSGLFRVIIESGNYFAYHSGRMSSSTTSYTFNETTIFGSDYDRILNSNKKLYFEIGLDGYAGGNNTAGSSSIFMSYNIVKSGTFGYNYDDTPNTDDTAGLYIGARANLYANSITGAKIEGGNINTVVGGYGYNGSENTNSTFIGMSGGTVRSIYGGAGHSTTKGNRIICVTGGTVSYSVLGGSNSFESGYDDDGVLQGSTLVYVGGNVTVGGGTGTLYGVESGSVFGAGGGDTSSTQKGTVYNSHVIINGGTINTSVYGGGNYGSTGTQYSGTSDTKIEVLSGTIGSVFGGSKSADFGKSGYESSSTIDIDISGGTIGNVYGGSNTEGTIYGSVDIDITGGTITNNVYGGGQGNQTVVRRDVDVTIGNSSTGPTIRGSVYGGSAYGTVNSNNAGEVNVTVNKGTVTGSVFGGGQGSSNYTPYVNGDITVTVNGGTIGNVFGGNDQAGSHTKNNEVHLNGGTITNAYGGGNLSSVTNTHVYLDGSTVTNLYGGSNTSGNVSTTTVVVTTGSVGNVYGGNNAGGTDGSTSVDIIGGTVTGNVYGGGKGNATVVSGDANVTIGNSSTGPTISGSVYGGSAYGTVNSANSGEVNVTVNKGTIVGSVFGGGQGSSTYTPYVNGDITVTINGGDITAVFGGNDQAGSHTKNNEVHLNGGIITNAYGGGNRSSVTNTNVYMNGATVTNIYGGSNTLGDVSTTNVNITSGTVQKVYGGNNEGGTCGTTQVVVNGTATISNSVFGGGNQVNTTTTNVTLTSAGATIPNVYGGGDTASVTTANVIKNGTNVTNLFGGSNLSGSVNNSYITHNSGTSTYVYGGNNAGGNTVNTHITYTGGTSTYVYGGGNNANSGTSNVTVTGGTITNVFGGGNNAGLTTSNVTISSGNVTNIYGGSNNTGNVTNTNVTLNNASSSVNAIFGGGNLATVTNTNVTINNGTVTNVYGGGNYATTSGNTIVDVNGGTISTNLYGGGNLGVVQGNSTVTITDATILGSAYAGGNGVLATLQGNTSITIDGDTVIGTSSSVAPTSGCVFGGGNQAATGLEPPTGQENNPAYNNSISTVNINSGIIYGNVYGGANTSTIWGSTDVNIGTDTITNGSSLDSGNLHIYGHVFGGGDANPSGDEVFDWNYESVKKGVNISIDGSNYSTFLIDGSFFGGGNAAKAMGDTYLYINNYGTITNPKRNISIQRVDYVTIDSSAMLLNGAVDRANEYDSELFSISRVKELTIKDGTTLYLKTKTNLLEEFSSVDASDNPAVVTINEDNNTFVRTVDNRLYIYEGMNVNVAHNQQVTDPGDVNGMTFLGIFTIDEFDNINKGNYDETIDPGDILNWSGEFNRGVYVLGVRKNNHDIEVDGFYSNYMNEDTSVNEVKYVHPTNESVSPYIWYIGSNALEYNVNLIASKYSTLGSVEKAFIEFSEPNTSFQITDFDFSEITPGINLIDKYSIPRVASNVTDANNNFGLVMEASPVGWLTNGHTSFYTSSPKIAGETYYEGENSSFAPSMLFYLYHSKNLTEAKDLGTVRISVVAITRLNNISNSIRRLVINVNMSTALFQTTEYEGAMTPGDKYEIFASTQTNITTKSKYSAYFSIFAAGENLYQNGYHHSLSSSFAFPENTKITMIDFVGSTPDYYYHIITAAEASAAISELAIEGDCSYDLDMFTKMGSLDNSSNYDEISKRALYYDGTDSAEEFIFIVDFSDTNINSDSLGNTLLMELRDGNDETLISVLGIQHSLLTYNLYANSDSVIDTTVTGDRNPLYIGYSDVFDVVVDYSSSTQSGVTITDTQYFDSKLGMQIRVKNNANQYVSGTDLTGTYFLMDNIRYYPDIDGVTHIKLANRVGNIEKWITFNTDNSNLATGSYTFVFETFGSPDGIYYSNSTPDYYNLAVSIINSDYGLNPIIDDNSVIFSANNDKNLAFTINYTSVMLDNPSIRLAMYRRKYDTIYDTNYELVDFADFASQSLFTTSEDKVYLLTSNPLPVNNYNILLNSSLTTGTYRLVFMLYDGDTKIGDVIRYIIVK